MIARETVRLRVLVVTALLLAVVVTTIAVWPSGESANDSVSSTALVNRVVSEQATATPSVAAWVNGEPVYMRALDIDVLLALGAGTGYTRVVESGAFITVTSACETVLDELVNEELEYRAGVTAGHTASITEVAEWVEKRLDENRHPMLGGIERVSMHVISTTDETDYEAHLEEMAGPDIIRMKWRRQMNASAEPIGEETVGAAAANIPTGSLLLVPIHVTSTAFANDLYEDLAEAAQTMIEAEEFEHYFIEHARHLGSVPSDPLVGPPHEAYSYTSLAELPDYAAAATHVDEGYTGMMHRDDDTASLYYVLTNRQINRKTMRGELRDRLSSYASLQAWRDAVGDLRAAATITLETDCATYVPPPWPY